MKKWLSSLLLLSICFNPLFGEAKLSRPFTKEEKQLVIDLYDIGVIRFDSEAWKDFFPDPLPYYIDLRHIISYPEIAKNVVKLFTNKAKELSFDTVCGVPYTGLPFASNVSYELKTPLIMRRAHRKNYATAKKIEGVIKTGMHCLLIDDVVFTATSLLETIQDLEEEQIKVTDCIVLMERQQGGIEFAKSKGYAVHAIFNISDFLHILKDAEKIDETLVQEILDWTEKNQVPGFNWKKLK